MWRKIILYISGFVLASLTVQAKDNMGIELNTFVVEMTESTYLLADINDIDNHYYMDDDLVNEKIEVGDILTGYGMISPQENYPPSLIRYDFQVVTGKKASEEDIRVAKEISPRGEFENELMVEWGKILYEYSDKIQAEDADIQYIDRDELNRTIEFYKLRGDEDPEEPALKYVAENQALYIEAINKGVEVTDLEILLYLEEMKEQLENADNNQEYKIMIEQFPSEEEYWLYQYEISKKSMLVDNYLEQRGTELVNQNILDIYSPDFQDNWAKALQIIKDELVEKHFPGNLMDYVK